MVMGFLKEFLDGFADMIQDELGCGRRKAKVLAVIGTIVLWPAALVLGFLALMGFVLGLVLMIEGLILALGARRGDE